MNQPVIRPIPFSRDYILVEDFQISLMGIDILIRAGFIFDGASIPRAAWTLLGYTPFHPCVVLAALVHDFLYRTGQTTRKKADVIFRVLLLKNGVSILGANQMYLAVRAGGGAFYAQEQQDTT